MVPFQVTCSFHCRVSTFSFLFPLPVQVLKVLSKRGVLPSNFLPVASWLISREFPVLGGDIAKADECDARILLP